MTKNERRTTLGRPTYVYIRDFGLNWKAPDWTLHRLNAATRREYQLESYTWVVQSHVNKHSFGFRLGINIRRKGEGMRKKRYEPVQLRLCKGWILALKSWCAAKKGVEGGGRGYRVVPRCLSAKKKACKSRRESRSKLREKQHRIGSVSQKKGELNIVKLRSFSLSCYRSVSGPSLHIRPTFTSIN